MTDAKSRAEKIYKLVVERMYRLFSDGQAEAREDVKAEIAAQIEEAVRESHYELAQKQANVMGESVMLCGKLVTNEELYKQPTDYVKDARAEGYAAAREEAAGIAEETTEMVSNKGVANAIRQMKGGGRE